MTAPNEAQTINLAASLTDDQIETMVRDAPAALWRAVDGEQWFPSGAPIAAENVARAAAALARSGFVMPATTPAAPTPPAARPRRPRRENGATAPEVPPPGRADAAEMALASIEGAADDEPPRAPRRPLIWMRDADPMLESSYLVKGLFGIGQLALVYGASQSGKTFLAIDLACHVAAGIPWRGRRVNPGLVAYVAAEAGETLQRRVYAWRERRLADSSDGDLPFVIVPFGFALTRRDEVDKLIELVREVGRERNLPVALVVVDTLSRSLAGADENKDLPLVVEAADRLRDEIGCATMFVHHTGKVESAGPRGHSSLFAAVDWSAYVADTSEGRRATVDKTRDGLAMEQFDFKLERVVLGEDQDGDEVSTCLIEHERVGETVVGENPRRRARAASRLSGSAVVAREALAAAINDADVARRGGTPGGAPGTATLNAWREQFNRRYGADAPDPTEGGSPSDRTRAARGAFQRGKDKLLELGLVVIDGDTVSRP